MSGFKVGDVIRTKGYPSFEFVVVNDKVEEDGKIGVLRFYTNENAGSGCERGHVDTQTMRVQPAWVELVLPKSCDPFPCGELPPPCDLPPCCGPFYASENGGDLCDNEAMEVGVPELFDILIRDLEDGDFEEEAVLVKAAETKYHAVVRRSKDVN